MQPKINSCFLPLLSINYPMIKDAKILNSGWTPTTMPIYPSVSPLKYACSGNIGVITYSPS